MKLRIHIMGILFILTQNVQAQNDIDSAGVQLQKWASMIQTDTTLSGRLYADSLFTKKLVQTLKQPFSYNYKLDSLKSIKQITSPDKAFKFYSWQVDLGDGTYRQRGAMQLPTQTGNLQLIPFFDQSDFVTNIGSGVTDSKHWMGAIYYDIIPTLWEGKIYYTLLGYDEYTNGISRKIVDILHFENGQPLLGGDFFRYTPDPSFPSQPIDRLVYAYKKGSNAIIRYDTQSQTLVISELTSTENDLHNPSTLVPSGVDIYFKWENGKWQMKGKK